MGSRLEFGAHALDQRTGVLSRDGVPIAIQQQPRELLRLLIERDGALVTREEIRATLWPDVTVDFEASINYAIRHIRIALGSDANLIQTVPRRGYRFAGTVRRAVPIASRPWARAAAAAIIAALALGFGAGLSASRTGAGTFMYEHLAHPLSCPYVKLVLPVLVPSLGRS